MDSLVSHRMPKNAGDRPVTSENKVNRYLHSSSMLGCWNSCYELTRIKRSSLKYIFQILGVWGEHLPRLCINPPLHMYEDILLILSILFVCTSRWCCTLTSGTSRSSSKSIRRMPGWCSYLAKWNRPSRAVQVDPAIKVVAPPTPIRPICVPCVPPLRSRPIGELSPAATLSATTAGRCILKFKSCKVCSNHISLEIRHMV